MISSLNAYIITTTSISRKTNMQLSAELSMQQRTNGLLGVAVLICAKLSFAPVELRNMYICPYGANSDNELIDLRSNIDNYKCMTSQDYIKALITAPILTPNDDNFDKEIIKIKTTPITRVGTKQ